MAKDPYTVLGKNLEKVRNILMFPRELMAIKSKIDERSIERVEKNDKYLNVLDREKYIEFLGLSEEILMKENLDYTWQEIVGFFMKKHAESLNLLEIPPKHLSALNVIKYRALPGNLLLSPISASKLTSKISKYFKYTFNQNVVQNALNNLSKEGTIQRTDTSPIQYYRPIKNFPKYIDPLYELVQNLYALLEKPSTNLVNKTLRKNAKILVFLKEEPKFRADIFEEIRLSNETNNVRRTIDVLESFELISKTESAKRSSLQKYKLTDKGLQLLRKSNVI